MTSPPPGGTRSRQALVTIRKYQDSDAVGAGRLIAHTYSAFNLDFATPKEQADLLGPFHFAESKEPAHRAAIAQVLAAPLILVAEEAGAIVRRPDRLLHRDKGRM